MVYATKANNRTIQCIKLFFFYHVHIIQIHLCKEYNFQYILYYIYICIHITNNFIFLYQLALVMSHEEYIAYYNITNVFIIVLDGSRISVIVELTRDVREFLCKR